MDDLIKSTQTQKKLELEPDPLIYPPQSDMQIEGSMGKMPNPPATSSCNYAQDERARSLHPLCPEHGVTVPSLQTQHFHALASLGPNLPCAPLVHGHPFLLPSI